MILPGLQTNVYMNYRGFTLNIFQSDIPTISTNGIYVMVKVLQAKLFGYGYRKMVVMVTLFQSQ